MQAKREGGLGLKTEKGGEVEQSCNSKTHLEPVCMNWFHLGGLGSLLSFKRNKLLVCESSSK